MNLRFGLALASVALAAVLAACTSVSSASDAPGLDGTAWVLSSLPGRSLVPGSTVTLGFEAGRASGTDGCNRYTTSYTATRTTVTFAPTGASTMMACAPEVMEQARAFTSSLAGAQSYRVDAGQLVFRGGNGAVLATFAPQPQGVAGTAWRVTGYNNGKQAVVSVLGGTTLTMAFSADGRVSGSAGCNHYMGAYTSSGDALSFGPAATTRRMCPEPAGVMEQEQQFLKALESVATLRREGERAELRRADGALAVSLVREAAR